MRSWGLRAASAPSRVPADISIQSFMRVSSLLQCADRGRSLLRVATGPTRRARQSTSSRPARLNDIQASVSYGDIDDPLERTSQPLLPWGPWHFKKLREMATFIGPALAIPLADPLMSLVDTVCIGQFSTTLDLAALGPANVIFGFCQYIFGALQVAQLSLVAAGIRRQDNGTASRMLTCGITIALVCGALVTLTLLLFGSSLIQATGVNDLARVLPLSAQYVSIRCWAQPAVLLTMVCQAGLLAQQDAVTPMLAVLAAVTVSAVGNVVFVAGLGWGLVGAAVTTVTTQYVGAAVMLSALLRAKQARPARQLPSLADLLAFVATMGPLTLTYLCKNLCYLMINVTATSLQTAKLAAHQAVYCFWNLLAFAVGPVEQAALAFMPAAKTLAEKRAMAQVLFTVGGGAGTLGASVVYCSLVGLPQAFCKDPSLWASMASVAPQATASLLLLGVDVASNGINIALGDSAYLAQSFVVTLALMFGYMAACRTYHWGLGGIWSGILCFFGLRALQSVGRVCLVHLGRAPLAPRQGASGRAE